MTRLTITEVAAELRCSEKTVRRAIRRGDLRAVMFGGRYLIHEEEVTRARGASPLATPRDSVNVYIVTDGDVVKIGCTSRDVDTRIRNIERASGRRLRVVKVIRNVDREYEVMLHQEFASDRIIGEWFRPPIDLVPRADALLREWTSYQEGAAA